MLSVLTVLNAPWRTSPNVGRAVTFLKAMGKGTDG